MGLGALVRAVKPTKGPKPKGKPQFNLEVNVRHYTGSDEKDLSYNDIADTLFGEPLHASEDGFLLPGYVKRLETFKANIDVEECGFYIKALNDVLTGRRKSNHVISSPHFHFQAPISDVDNILSEGTYMFLMRQRQRYDMAREFKSIKMFNMSDEEHRKLEETIQREKVNAQKRFVEAPIEGDWLHPTKRDDKDGRYLVDKFEVRDKYGTYSGETYVSESGGKFRGHIYGDFNPRVYIIFANMGYDFDFSTRESFDNRFDARAALDKVISRTEIREQIYHVRPKLKEPTKMSLAGDNKIIGSGPTYFQTIGL